jgi:hypothetical protein
LNLSATVAVLGHRTVPEYWISAELGEIAMIVAERPAATDAFSFLDSPLIKWF